MSASLTPYFPRLLIDWQREAPGARYRQLDGTLVFMDISGFTAMSERLARKGKVGAEEVTEVMSSAFARLLAAAYAQGAYLLKFGGDAMFLLFVGDEHAQRGCRAAVDMRHELRALGRFGTSAGTVSLRMSVGVHSGEITFVLAGDAHRELLVVGNAVSETVRMEMTASAGQIVVSEATAARLRSSCLGVAAAPGVRLRRSPAVQRPVPAPIAPEAYEGAVQFIPAAVRDQLLAGIDESEHRAVAVAFVHFDGTDEMLERDGAGAAAEALDALVRRVQAAVQEYDVCLLASDIDVDGGKLILTAGAPTSGENDEERMLRALHSIFHSNLPMPLRAGVHRGAIFAGNVGPWYRRTYTVMGDAVNLAARLMAKAAPGEILSTRDVLDRSRTVFQTEALAPFSVKGKAAPVQAYRVGAPAGQRPRALEDGPLVGRERELQEMLNALARARAGAQLVELVGDAGIGKSRLLRELRAHMPHAPWLETACEQYESSTPYFAFRELLLAGLGIEHSAPKEDQIRALERIVDERCPELLPWLPLLGVVLDVEIEETRETRELQPAFRQARLSRTVADLMRALLREPAVLVIEDAHWLDEASRTLLTFMLDHAQDAPWLWCATRRSGGAAMSGAESSRRIRLQLDPLSADASARLARESAGDVALRQHDLEAVAERAAGNPLFLRELVASHIGGTLEGLPDSVEALVVSRIDALEPAERRALRYAAVLGAAFDAQSFAGSFGALLEDGSPADPLRWERLDEFVERDGGAIRFRHALVREVAYDALPFRLRRRLHARAGTYLEHGVEHTEEAAALLSLHFSLAHEFEPAYRYSRVAGERSKAKWANVEAAEFFRRAITAARQLRGIEPQEVAGLYEALGDVCELAAQYDDAAEAYRAARASDPSSRRRVLIKEAIVRERMGRYAAAVRTYARALRDADDDAADRARIGIGYAAVRFRQGKYADCAAWCRRAIPDADAAHDRASLAHAYFLLGHASSFLGSGEGPAFRLQALRIYEELGDLIGQANVLNNMGVAAYYYEAQWGEAMAYYRRSRDARERAGDIVGAATAANNIAEILSDQGALDEARALLDSALETWRAAQYPVGIALATSNLGWLDARSRDFERARERLESALGGFRTIRADSFVFETEVRLAELASICGEHDGAQSRVARLIERARQIDGVDRVVPALYRLLAEELVYQQDDAGARNAITESIARARSSGAGYELMLALEASARHALTSEESCRAFIEEAHQIRTRLGVGTAAAALEARTAV